MTKHSTSIPRAKAKPNQKSGEAKYYAIYRRQVVGGMEVPKGFRDLLPQQEDQHVVAFVYNMGELDESQLDGLFVEVLANCMEIRRSETWEDVKEKIGVVHVVSEDARKEFPLAVQMRIDMVLPNYTRVMKEGHFVTPALLKPLYTCVKYIEKLRGSQNAENVVVSNSMPTACGKKSERLPTKPRGARKNPTKKEHKQKILDYISRFLTLSAENTKVNKTELAAECGLRPEAVTRKKSKYYDLIKAAEDKVKRPNFFHDKNAAAEFYFETRRKLGFE